MKVYPSETIHPPELFTFIEGLTTRGDTIVVPLSRFAVAALPDPGVKPAPENPTTAPVMACGAARVMLGGANMVSVAFA